MPADYNMYVRKIINEAFHSRNNLGEKTLKTLFIDCGMGAAGDMLTAALLELLPDPDSFITKLNGLGIPGTEVKTESTVKCGIQGTHFMVTVNHEEEGEEMPDHDHGQEILPVQMQDKEGHSHEHLRKHSHNGKDFHVHFHVEEEVLPNDQTPEMEHHHHSRLEDIEAVISGLEIPENVQQDVLAVYRLIAEAESHVHGVPVTDIHFHEVGTMDAVTDITAVCLLMNEIAPDEVVVSPIHVGCGQVRCAHGILPVPAPATLHILQDVPIYGGEIKGELCTPTGAALLKHFADRFGNMPVMKTKAVGYGMGKKDFKWANCVRAVLGESIERSDSITELSFNVDDMTGEAVGFAMERLFEAGAKDVYFTPIYMKKSRPAVKICVLCAEEDREKIVRCIYKHTSTIGIRETVMGRYCMERRIEILQTTYGNVRRKVSEGYGTRREKLEYEDLARIANERDLSIAEVRRRLADL